MTNDIKSDDSKAKVKTEPCEDKPRAASLKFLLAPSDEVEISAGQLKKRQRNERDRKRVVAKRETMEQMRKTVAALELQKQQLMQHMVANSPCASSSTLVTRDNFVQLAAEVEEFRRQNAAMVQEFVRRDLFNNSLRYRLSSFANKKRVEPTQLTHEEGLACVWKALEQIREARLLYASEERFHNRPTFLGWSQYAERQGDVVALGVKKTIRNVTPQQLMNRTWQLQTDNDKLKRLGPSHLHTHITVPQKITDDILIVDLRTEDQSRTNKNGGPLVLRTLYVLFRVKDDDGSQTLGVKTLDVPVADRMLRDD